jgi:hypothetical protein
MDKSLGTGRALGTGLVVMISAALSADVAVMLLSVALSMAPVQAPEATSDRAYWMHVVLMMFSAAVCAFC